MDSNQIKISVIMPIHNAGEVLHESIHSIRMQSLKDWELILIDDCSTDNSVDIALKSSQADSRIRVEVLSSNQGVSVARNRGISKSVGKYICFIDADDLLEPNGLEVLLETAKTQYSDLIITPHLSFEGQKKELAWVYREFPELLKPGKRTIEHDFEILQVPYCWGKLFDRELLKDIRFKEGITFGEDQAFIIQAYLKAEKIYMLDTPLYLYRHSQHQVTKSNYLRSIEYLENIMTVFALVKEYIFKSDLDHSNKEKLYVYYVKSYLFRNMFSFMANGLLSDEKTVKINVLNLYKEWELALEESFKKSISADLKEVYHRLEMISLTFDVETEFMYRELMDSLNNRESADIEDSLFDYKNTRAQSSELKAKPKITIQTLAYNAEGYIKECIDSVINQSFSDFEWLILDNGSTDNTSNILQEYASKDDRIKLFRSERNHINYNEPLNTDFVKAIMGIESEYWCVVDSDDYLDLDFMHNLYYIGKKHHADVIVAGTEKFFEDGRVKEPRRCPDFVTHTAEELGSFFPEIYFMFSVEWGKLVKVSVLKELIAYRRKHSEFLKHADDTLFSLELLKFCKTVVGTDQILHQYRIRDNSQYHSQIDENRFNDYIMVYQKNKELLENWKQLSYRNLNFIANKLFHSTTVCLDLIAGSTELNLEQKVAWYQNILNNDIFAEAISINGDFSSYLFAFIKDKMADIIHQTQDEQIPSLLTNYLYKLYVAINMANDTDGNNMTAFLLYFSSIFQTDNRNRFGSEFLYEFLSLIHGNLYEGLRKELDSRVIAQSLPLLRALVNSDTSELVEKAENPELKIIAKKMQDFLIEHSLNDLKGFAESLNAQVELELQQQQYESAIDNLLLLLDRFPLHREGLLKKLKLLMENQDFMSALVTAEALRTIYPEDSEVEKHTAQAWHAIGLI